MPCTFCGSDHHKLSECPWKKYHLTPPKDRKPREQKPAMQQWLNKSFGHEVKC